MYFKYVLVFFHFRLSARETAMCQITKTFTVFNKQKQKVHVFMANKLTLSLIAMAYLENHHIFKAVCFSFERYNISMVRKTKKNERRTLFLFTRRTNKSEQINRDVECLRHSQHSWTKTMKMFVCILFSHLVFARSHSFSLYHWPMCLCIRIYGWVCLVSVYTHFVIHFYEWQLTEKYLRANKTCTLFLAPFEIYMTKKYDAKYSKRARKTKQQQQQSMAGKNETGVKSEEHQTVVHELKKKEIERERFHEVIIQFDNIIIPKHIPLIQFYFSCFIIRLGFYFAQHYYTCSNCFAALSSHQIFVQIFFRRFCV